MYRRILVPVDGSESSLNALREAIRFARAIRSEVLALTVLPPYAGDVEFVIGGVMEEMEQSCRKVMEQVSGIAREEGVPVKTLVEEGEPAETILQMAEERGCDLVVMGRRGLKRLEYVLIGSTTRQLVYRGSGDVLVMPRDSAIDARRVLLALDGAPRSPEAAARAAQLAKASGEGVVILYAADPLTETANHSLPVVEAARRRASENGVPVEVVVREGKPAEVITAEAKETGATLIVLGRRLKPAMKPRLSGGVAEEVISSTIRPVLIVG